MELVREKQKASTKALLKPDSAFFSLWLSGKLGGKRKEKEKENKKERKKNERKKREKRENDWLIENLGRFDICGCTSNVGGYTLRSKFDTQVIRRDGPL